MKRVTNEDIRLMNELYYKYKSYAEVARQTGWSSSTVSKYIDKNFKPIDETKIKHVGVNDVPEFTTALFEGVENLGDLCVLSDDERVEIVDLWEEIAV